MEKTQKPGYQHLTESQRELADSLEKEGFRFTTICEIGPEQSEYESGLRKIYDEEDIKVIPLVGGKAKAYLVRKNDLKDLRNRVSSVIDGLEKTVYAVAKEVKALGTTCADEYAEAVLNRNGFGGDTAEIYFYNFAPEWAPSLSDKEKFTELMNDEKKSAEYHEACYNGWKEEIQKVQAIIEKHGGNISVDGIFLEPYLKISDKSIPTHRVEVTIHVPGQRELYTLNRVLENLDIK